jgi:deazaflavin-dependent oxidoreductase (nitroreductase family)
MIFKDPPFPIIDTELPLVVPHINQYLSTNGRNNCISMPNMLPIKFCLLTTKGRISSEWKRTVVFYTEYNNLIYIIGSNAGKELHANWYLNALVDPIVWIQHDLTEYWAVCKVLDAEDDSDLIDIIWKKMNKLYPMYSYFQKKAGDRKLPVVQIRRI